MLVHYEEPVITEVLTPDISRLYVDWSYWSERLGGKHTIKKGFEFDWDSIRQWKLIFYWWLKGKAKVAALIHDDLYQNGKFDGKEITRLEADLVFLDAMEEEMRKAREYKKLTGWKLLYQKKADYIRRNAIYHGVRIGGQKPWDEYRENER
jgi:hypothetical protein